MDEEALSQQILLADTEPPPASWKHILAVTVFLTLGIMIWSVHARFHGDWGTPFARIPESLGDGSPALALGMALAAVFQIRAMRTAFLQERALEAMDRDELDGGPWIEVDAWGQRLEMARVPLRTEPPQFLTPPDPIHAQKSEAVRKWLEIPENQALIDSATDFERDALAWCAQEGTPAGLDGAHGGTDLFTHVAEVWKQNAQAFGTGSEAALISAAHDLGKVLAYRRTGATWTRRFRKHERLSVAVAMHLPGFLALDEPTRRALMAQLVRYVQRRRSPIGGEQAAPVRSTVRADSRATLAEKAEKIRAAGSAVGTGKPVAGEHGPARQTAEIIPLPRLEPDLEEDGAELAGNGDRPGNGEACMIPFRDDDPLDGEMGADAEMAATRLQAQEISDNLPSAIAALNVNNRKRSSGQTQGIYCADTGFFVRVFDLVDQLAKMGLAQGMPPEMKTRSPWEAEPARAVLTAMDRSGWIVKSPGRLTSDLGNDGVFNLQSGARRYHGMVSIQQEMLSKEYLESIGEWCFDVDAVKG